MFLTQAHEYAINLNENSPERAFYDILTDNAVGHQNAISKKEIRRMLASYGHNCSRQLIASHTAASRRLPHFLGIKRYGGIYIIDSAEDARVTLDYYDDQIQGIWRHRDYLQRLCLGCGWQM